MKIDSIYIERWLELNIGFENAKLGLDRIKKALDTFPLKINSKVITITGTNGKGSCTRLLSSTLNQRYKTARFTSPHLKSIAERFSFNEIDIDLDELFKRIKLWKEKLDSEDLKLSYFEFLFFVFIQSCSERNTKETFDYIILEVGLGGRFDATNAIDPDISIITSIARDHQEFLGSRYDQILFEKLGIARKSKPLITSLESDYLDELVLKHQDENKFMVHRVKEATGLFNMITQSLVEKAIELLGLELALFQNKIDFNQKNHFYGSHNLAAVRKLVQYLKYYHYNISSSYFDICILSFSKRETKELNGMIALYKSLGVKVLLTSFSHFKALEYNQLISLAKNNGIEFADIKDIDFKDKRVLFSGSNYFIGAVKHTFNL